MIITLQISSKRSTTLYQKFSRFLDIDWQITAIEMVINCQSNLGMHRKVTKLGIVETPKLKLICKYDNRISFRE